MTFLARDAARPEKPSQWVASLPHGNGSGPKHDAVCKGRLLVQADATSVWLIHRFSGGAQLGLRVCFDPRGLAEIEVKSAEADATIRARGRMADIQVGVKLLDGPVPIVHYVTRLTPHEVVHIEAMPRDLCIFDRHGQALSTEGAVYVTQSGPTAGLAFFSVTRPGPATILYFQDLTALSDYCEITQAEASGSVTATWPEIGLSLPRGKEPLPARRAVVVSDAYVALSESLPASELDVSKTFVRLLAGIYRHIRRPATRYCDWPALAEKTLSDLAGGKDCRRRIRGQRYLNAYVGAVEKPPESMVQLAVLVPLTEYENWAHKKIRLREELRSNIPTFNDAKLKTLVRWLPGAKFGAAADSEEEAHERMDSWYYLHALINLARLAEFGDLECRELLLRSLDHAIRVGRHFNYDWPVFYQPETLEILKAETKPGAGGEHDVPGLYAHVMLQAFELTKDRRYLNEAEAAAQSLLGKGFRLLYQTNNTIMTAVALVKLWQTTNKRLYLDLSVICIANVIARFWIWNGNYGHAKAYDTFMGVAPLQDAEYVAAYEEHEFLAAVVNYLKFVGDEVIPEISALLSEYHKYLLHRGRFYFCGELPAAAVSKSPKEGKIDPALSIPLEDLRTGWQQSGQVGQEVYGSAAALIATSYTFIRLADVPFIVHAEYPVLRFDYRVEDGRGEVFLRVSGDPDYEFRLVMLPKSWKLPRISVMRIGAEETRLPVAGRRPGRAEFTARGGGVYRIEWAAVPRQRGPRAHGPEKKRKRADGRVRRRHQSHR